MIGWLLCKLWSHGWTVISIGQKPCGDVIDHWAVLVCRRCRRTSESHRFTEAALYNVERLKRPDDRRCGSWRRDQHCEREPGHQGDHSMQAHWWDASEETSNTA